MNNTLKVVGLIVIVFIMGFLSFQFFGSKENKNDTSDANLAAVDSLEQSEAITPTFTDDNSNETVIIKSDQEHYTGDREITSYFSVQNIAQTDENFNIQFYFPKSIDVNAEKVEYKTADGWADVGSLKEAMARPEAYKTQKPIPEIFGAEGRFTSSISSGETKYFRVKIVFAENAQGEFWIEAIGDKGGYGLLDPTFSHVTIRGGGSNGGNVRLRGGPASGGSGTISYDTSSGTTDIAVNSITWQHTVASGGVLFVSCSQLGNAGGTISSVTYDGVAMTQLWNTDLSGSGVKAESSGWLIVNPSTGSAKDIVCTLTGTADAYLAGAATSWTGVETSSVAAAHRTVFTRGDGDGGPSITITDSQNGDVVVTGIGNWGTNPVPADTSRVTQNNVGSSAYDHNHESLAATGANAVINYTGGQLYTMGATALIPAAVQSSGSVKFR